MAGAVPAVVDAPTGVPHRWQKRAPGARIVRQALQVPPRTAAPHSAQKRPGDGVPQEGHGIADSADTWRLEREENGCCTR
jgi:hypothetical protein